MAIRPEWLTAGETLGTVPGVWRLTVGTGLLTLF